MRGYLDGVGPVTVALPALGCGHGGLDWDRVSEMIRDKLDGVDAHVRVFEPAASRQAGRTATEQPTDDERKGAEQLGYALVEQDRVPALEAPGPLYILGNPEVLARSWIGLLPSRDPGDREMQALRAIAAELARSGTGQTLALVHGTRVSEEVAGIFLGEGVDVALLLPFGVLTRKALARQVGKAGAGSLTLVSAAPANGKWSRQLFGQTMDMLRRNAAAILLSDPEPDWLANKGLAKWGQTPMFYVRYEATPPAMRDALKCAGARAIGRRGEDGAPNIDFLIGRESQAPVSGNGGILKEASTSDGPPEVPANNGAGPHHETLALMLDGASEAERREVFDLLMRTASSQVALKVTLSPDASESDRQRLMDLGFRETQAL